MLEFKLRREGKKHQPYFRIIVTEQTATPSGKFVDIVGAYNPFSKKMFLNNDKVLKWLNRGVKPTNSVAKILEKEGIKHKLVIVKKFSSKAPKAEMKAKEAPDAAPALAKAQPEQEKMETKNETNAPHEPKVKESKKVASNEKMVDNKVAKENSHESEQKGQKKE